MEIQWLDRTKEHNFPAAKDYLSLIAHPTIVERTIEAMQNTPLIQRKAKDILRSSRLALLPETNSQVAKNLDKIANGKPLSPILLVRGDGIHGVPLHVADGYHRLSACYHFDANTPIPCHLVSWVCN